MSAILSTDDLNDFIGPGVACIKPVETLPAQQPQQTLDPYEVTTEDAVAAEAKKSAPAQISLTDCLACSGCVTSAEAVLVSLQSHEEVLRTLDEFQSVDDQDGLEKLAAGHAGEDVKVFVASVSPQTRASLAAMYSTSERKAGYMIEQLLSGPMGLRKGGNKNSGFLWVWDTNTTREFCQAAGVKEVKEVLGEDSSLGGQPHDRPKKPILASVCPGWICYAEKTHPHILPHLSRLKSPQGMSGTLVKTVLSQRLNIHPSRIWHLSIMPCFDKKLEASRQELTDMFWNDNKTSEEQGVRDVDCVITAREILMLADSRGISFPNLPQRPPPHISFPDNLFDNFLFPRSHDPAMGQLSREAGPSGGYAYTILQKFQAENPGSNIFVERGRNADVIEYQLILNNKIIMKTARYFGFRNIQNLVRKLKPPKTSRLPGSKSHVRAAAAAVGTGLDEYAYIEVMACPGGCTNGGGQIKASDLPGTGETNGQTEQKVGPAEQKQWLARIDEAYYSAESSEDDMDLDEPVNGLNGHSLNGVSVKPDFNALCRHWSDVTGIEISKLAFTSYRQVESDVGKEGKKTDTERVATLASSLGGGW